MIASSRAFRTGALLVVLFAAGVVASCGPGNNTAPAAIPTAAATAATLSTTAGSFSAPTVNGLSVTFNLAAGAPANTTVSATSSVTAPSGVLAPSSTQRQTQSIAGAVPFLYVSLSFSQAVPTSVFTSEMLTLTSSLSSTASYFMEIDDPSASPPKVTTITGTLAAGVATFSNSNGSGSGSQLTTLAANHTYVFQFYYVAASTATASPTATATATGSASASPTATATATGSSSPQTVFTFTSTGGTANITAGTGGQTLTTGSPVGGVSASSTWGTNNASQTVAMTAQLATGNGDITSNSSTSFPLFTASNQFDNTGTAVSGYTVVDYLELTATPRTTFTQTPAITVTIGAPATIAGKTTCSYFSLNGTSGANLQWNQALTGTIGGGGTTVTFAAATLPQGNTVDVGNATSSNIPYLALACK